MQSAATVMQSVAYFLGHYVYTIALLNKRVTDYAYIILLYLKLEVISLNCNVTSCSSYNQMSV